MNRHITAIFTLTVGIALGFYWSESRYARLRERLTFLTENDIDDYLRLKRMEEKYAKADEILGKAMLIFLTELGLRLSDAQKEFAKKSSTPKAPDPKKPLPTPYLPSPRETQAPLVITSDKTRKEVTGRSLTPPSGNAGSSATVELRAVLGTVKLTVPPPESRIVNMRADPFCTRSNADVPAESEEVIVSSNGGLGNVFIYIKEGLADFISLAPEEAVVIDQAGCRYEPHVVGVQTGQPLRITNSDATLHNVHALTKNNPGFNQGMPTTGNVIEKKFTKPETMVRLKCDVHGWMSAYIGVVSHPFFAVSDASGFFRIRGLPPGDYTLEAWHEKYGTKTQRVSVGRADLAKAIRFAFP